LFSISDWFSGPTFSGESLLQQCEYAVHV